MNWRQRLDDRVGCCFFCNGPFLLTKGCYCLRAQAYDKIEKALKDLPSTTEDLLEFFRKTNRTYPVGTVDKDPVAIYLYQLFPKDYLLVVYPTVNIRVDNNKFVRVPMPFHITEFLHNFDDLQYLDLISRPMTDWDLINYRLQLIEAQELVSKRVFRSVQDYLKQDRKFNKS